MLVRVKRRREDEPLEHLGFVKNDVKKAKSENNDSGRPMILFKRCEEKATSKSIKLKTIDLERVNEAVLQVIQSKEMGTEVLPKSDSVFVYDEYRMMAEGKALENVNLIPCVAAWDLEDDIFLPEENSDLGSDKDYYMMDEDSNAEDYFANEYPDEDESYYRSDCDSEDSFRPSTSFHQRRRNSMDEYDYDEFDDYS